MKGQKLAISTEAGVSRDGRRLGVGVGGGLGELGDIREGEKDQERKKRKAFLAETRRRN